MKCQCCPHLETNQLICSLWCLKRFYEGLPFEAPQRANQLTGFYMRVTLAYNGLKNSFFFQEVLISEVYEYYLPLNTNDKLLQILKQILKYCVQRFEKNAKLNRNSIYFCVHFYYYWNSNENDYGTSLTLIFLSAYIGTKIKIRSN